MMRFPMVPPPCSPDESPRLTRRRANTSPAYMYASKTIIDGAVPPPRRFVSLGAAEEERQSKEGIPTRRRSFGMSDLRPRWRDTRSNSPPELVAGAAAPLSPPPLQPTNGRRDEPSLPRHLASKYVLQGKIGEGTFGSVWQAHDRRSARPVAVKQVSMLPRHHEEVSAAILTEAKVTASLNHRSLVRLLDAAPAVIGADGSCGRLEILVLEWCPNGDLLEAVNDGLCCVAAKAYMVQVVDGLAYMLSAGFVHGDVKPENVLLCGDTAKLCDFGLTGRVGEVRLGLACGSTPYMPPELLDVREGERYAIDPAFDVWSFGITLYAVLFSDLPWSEATEYDPAYVSFVLDPEIHTSTPWALIPCDLRRCLIKMLGRCDRRPHIASIAEAIRGPWPDPDGTKLDHSAFGEVDTDGGDESEPGDHLD